MKTKITKKFVRTFIILGAATFLALPLQAGRGGSGSGGGNAGDCPQGFEPGTRSTQNCTRGLDGSGSQYRGKVGSKGQNSGNGTCDGSGQKQQKKNGGGNGAGQGTGNPEDCPNYGG